MAGTTDPVSSANALPSRQLAVTWGIPDRYGGMTSALLRRSRLFAAAGARADVVTFEPRPDYAAVRARLEERGELAGGVGLRNIYEDFRHRPHEPRPVDVLPQQAECPPDEVHDTGAGSVHRWLDGAAVARVEHRRADGSLAVLEQRPHPEAPHRVVTSFDATGRTTGQWSSVRHFRFAWLDELLDGHEAVAIVDSKTAAGWMQHYRRAQVTRIHMVHGAHHDSQGRLTASRRDLFEHLDRWDAVVFLTERQRAAAVGAVGDSGNLEVVPNAVNTPEWMPRLPPDRLHGVIASRLSTLKRIDHSLQVIARVRDLGVPVTAEIIGDGSQRRRLEAEAARLGLSDAVTFAGYVSDCAERFTRGSWTLLTSRSEGTSLALLEAMGTGCLRHRVRTGRGDP
ncbi:glycosyltransferase [Microbacterium ureisolvens]|uniref:glycosyltransferase n=1 Tax=Microbacterium ureisolvens TaxID=2781186 RepID=UPI0036383609